MINLKHKTEITTFNMSSTLCTLKYDEGCTLNKKLKQVIDIHVLEVHVDWTLNV